MWVVASTFLILAAASALPSEVPPPPPAPTEYASETALQHYLQGRLLEERGAGRDALGEIYRSLLLDPRAPAIARRMSEMSAKDGESERSLDYAERALALSPGDARSLWLKGAALFNLGRTNESLAALQAAVDVDSSRIEYVQSWARVAEQLNRIDLVERAYARLVDLDEGEAESWFQLAAARARLGKFQEAHDALQRVVEDNPDRPGLNFLRGWVEEGLGRPAAAIALYRQHLQVHVNDHVTRRRLVHLLATGGLYAEAYREARLVSRALPDDVEAIGVEAELAFRTGHTSEGTRLTQRLVKSAGDDPDHLLPVVAMLARSGRNKASIEVADQWQAGHPGDARGLLLGARARALAGQNDGAIDRAKKAVAAEPDSLEPRVLLGRLFNATKRYREAEQLWEESSNRFPEQVGVMLDLALAREKLGDLAGAEQAARSALARQPDDPRRMNFLGYMLADHGLKLAEAHELIDQAVERDPDNGAYVDSKGWVLYRLGRLPEAREQLERAVQLTGGDPIVCEHLGDVYKDLRLMELAREQYRKSLLGDGTNDRVRAKLQEVR